MKYPYYVLMFFGKEEGFSSPEKCGILGCDSPEEGESLAKDLWALNRHNPPTGMVLFSPVHTYSRAMFEERDKLEEELEALKTQMEVRHVETDRAVVEAEVEVGKAREQLQKEKDRHAATKKKLRARSTRDKPTKSRTIRRGKVVKGLVSK